MMAKTICTLSIRGGFDVTYEPAGHALCNLVGEFELEAVEEVLQLMDTLSSRLRKKVADAKEQLAALEP